MRRSTSVPKTAALARVQDHHENADIDLEIDPESDRGGGLSDGPKENTGPVPVRKGTLSKDLHYGSGGVTYTVVQVLQRAHYVAVLFLILPVITIGAYATGNLHLVSGIAAVANALMTMILSMYKIVNRKRESDKGVLMMGFGIYITIPLGICSGLAFYFTKRPEDLLIT
eukprot:FR739720.1.p1 GENE.FR739720.1~~FR739720.1.p1  ORF type:complete len:170 (+),score=13.95 FR739720.1:51-560(+)